MYSLLLVDFNSIEKTVDYIESCRASMGAEGSSHVVIIQNGDGKTDLKVLTDRYGDPVLKYIACIKKEVQIFQNGIHTIVYFESGENMGYARGNNLAATIAETLWGDDYYIVSNNDLEFPSRFDLHIADNLFEEDCQIGAIGPQVVTPEGDIQSPRRWIGAGKKLIASYWINCLSGFFGNKFRAKMYNRYGRDIIFGATSGYYAWISGCFMLLRAKAFHDAGMFDENTFLYAEEPILAKRLEKVKSRVYFCDKLKVIHAHGATTKNHLKMMKMIKTDFESNVYLYKNYFNTSPVVLICSKVSFSLYCFMVRVKNKLFRRK